MTRMGEVICFDTAPLIWGVRGDSTRGQESEIEKTKSYISVLRSSHKQIMVPAPVLTEYLVGASDTELHELDVLKQGFQIANLDAASAVLAASLQRGDLARVIHEDFGVERQCIKIDALIIAIAITNHASRIITHDIEHFKVLARGRIPVSGVPASESQLDLGWT